MSLHNNNYLLNDSSRRHSFLGSYVDLLTMEETLDSISTAISNNQKILQSDLNVAKFIMMKSDSSLHNAVNKSDLINIDGMGLLIACKLLGIPVKEKVSGVDLLMKMMERCAERGFRPYFLGSKQEVVEKAVSNVEKLHPKIEFAGFRNGYFSAEDEADIIAEINEVKPDCIFVGISSPIKEIFLYENRDKLQVPYMMGVGGAFDVVAGKVKRAPVWMQNYGLEWLYRLLQEPKRMWKRYLSTNTEFFLILVRALFDKNILRQNIHSLNRKSN